MPPFLPEAGLTASRRHRRTNLRRKSRPGLAQTEQAVVLPPHKVMLHFETHCALSHRRGQVTLKKYDRWVCGRRATAPFRARRTLNHFGRYGYALYDLVRGTDGLSPSKPNANASNLHRNHPARRPLEQAADTCPILLKTCGGKSRAKTSSPKRNAQAEDLRFRIIHTLLAYSSILPI